MKLLITGASGFVGQDLLRRLCAFSGVEVSGTYRTRGPKDETLARWYQAELADQERLDELFRQAQPDVVVHLAGMSDVEVAEKAPNLATEVNVKGTERIAYLCAQHGARLVFLSTDYVFPGRRGRYREGDAPQPTLHYSRTKWEAEQCIARGDANWSILRTCLVYGWGPSGCHGTFPTAVIDAVGNSRPFYGYTDVYRTPVYVGDLSHAIMALAMGDHQGIYHCGGADWISMYDFALAVADVFQLDSRLVMPAVSISDFLSDSPPMGQSTIDLAGLPECRRARIPCPAVQVQRVPLGQPRRRT